MRKLIECVPNFSEGRDLNVIPQITDAIESAHAMGNRKVSASLRAMAIRRG